MHPRLGDHPDLRPHHPRGPGLPGTGRRAPRPSKRHHMTHTLRTIPRLLAAAAALALAACSGATSPTVDDATAGYVSGDGSVRTWAPPTRGEGVELAGEAMSGEVIDIGDWRGDVVVVNFWYAECPPCRKEAPDLAALSQEYAGEAHFLGVNHINEPETALAFERRFEVPYPTLHDRDAAAVASLQEYVALQAMPTTLVLDGQGRVAARVLGMIDKTTLSSLIADTLAET